MDDVYKALLIHSLPGRIRIRVPGINNCENSFQQVARNINQLDGIQNVTPNALTNSLLVTYDVKRTDEEALILKLKTDNILSVEKALLNSPEDQPETENVKTTKSRKSKRAEATKITFETLVKKSIKKVNRWFTQMTGDTVDLTVIIPILLFALAIRDLAIRRAQPPWYNLIWYAIGLYRYMHKETNSVEQQLNDLAKANLEVAPLTDE